MKTLACIAVAAAALASPAAAQNVSESRSTIVVTGTGQAERDPDRFRVVADIEGQGRTRVEALEALAQAQARVSHALTNLEGLTTADLTTDDTQVGPVRDPDCDSDYANRCAITGYRVTAKLTLEGSPVARAGDAVSLAAEQGAESVSLASTFLSTDSELRAEASRAAFDDARQQADLFARASGQRIVRITQIQTQGAGNTYVDELIGTVPIGRSVTSVNLLAPTVRLDVAPEPVVVRTRVHVTFEVE